jgi:hypothetical protein
MGESTLGKTMLQCSKSELKLIIRLRQIRRDFGDTMVCIRTTPLTLYTFKNPEYLEASGSAAG